MNDSQRIAIVRVIHAAIHLAMAAATFALLYAGVTGAQGAWRCWGSRSPCSPAAA